MSPFQCPFPMQIRHSNKYLIATVCVDAAENEPEKVSWTTGSMLKKAFFGQAILLFSEFSSSTSRTKKSNRVPQGPTKKQVYRLSQQFQLDVSLFERLIRNGAPHVTLSHQRRMRPEVRRCEHNSSMSTFRFQG